MSVARQPRPGPVPGTPAAGPASRDRSSGHGKQRRPRERPGARASTDAADELERLLARVPEGWTEVGYANRRWGLRGTSRVGAAAVSVYAEQLGGTDVVSANVYRTGSGLALRPCEMPAATVLAFLRGWSALTFGPVPPLPPADR